MPSVVTPRLHTMLLTNQSPKASLLPDWAKTTQRGNNGTPSAHGCASQPTYKASRTQSPSYKSSLTRSAQASLQPITSPSTNEVWSNISAPWDRSLQPWGGQTQDSPPWAPSIFDWDNSLRPKQKKILPFGIVRPLPVYILHCMDSISQGRSPRERSIADLSWIAFFFLL